MLNPQSSIRNLSLYLHIPFCIRLCPYCHFYRVPEIPDWKVYLGAVTRELDSLEKEYTGKIIHTLYVGGGTPTELPPEFYHSLFNIIGDRFDLAELAEATIETDGKINEQKLADYASAGFDRVSIGVKSFDLHIRDILGVGELPGPDPVSSAHSAGFSSVGLDLIYGIEGQSIDDFSEDLEKVVNLQPDHISLYMLEGPEVEKESGEPGECDPDLTAAMFRESVRVLGAAGFRQYEITNFARPGQESLHNTVYWEDGDFIGLGPSAHSAVTISGTVDGTRIRWRNRPDIAAYLKDATDCREELSREEGTDRAREALILGLRMTKGVYRPAFVHRYGFDPLELLGPHAGELKALGLIRYSTSRVRLTVRGMLLSNEVFVRILGDG